LGILAEKYRWRILQDFDFDVPPYKIVCADCYYTSPEYKNQCGSVARKEYLIWKKKEKGKVRKKKFQ
jgi:hypothetical protein